MLPLSPQSEPTADVQGGSLHGGVGFFVGELWGKNDNRRHRQFRCSRGKDVAGQGRARLVTSLTRKCQ